MEVMTDYQTLQLSAEKVDSLETQLALLNRAYLDEIRKLKDVLKQKTIKQLALKSQVEQLKVECKSHGEQIMGLLQKTTSPVKSHRSNKSQTEVSIWAQPAHKKSQQDINMNLSLKFPVDAHQPNKKMNSPRFKLLKQATAIDSIELKLKQKQQDGRVQNEAVSGRTQLDAVALKTQNEAVGIKVQNQAVGMKAGSPANFIQLKHSHSNKQPSLCQDKGRYSYQFKSSVVSPKQKHYLARSIGYTTKNIQPQDKSIQTKRKI